MDYLLLDPDTGGRIWYMGQVTGHTWITYDLTQMLAEGSGIWVKSQITHGLPIT